MLTCGHLSENGSGRSLIRPEERDPETMLSGYIMSVKGAEKYTRYVHYTTP